MSASLRQAFDFYCLNLLVRLSAFKLLHAVGTFTLLLTHETDIAIAKDQTE